LEPWLDDDKKKLRENEQQRQGSEDDSQTHGELQAIQVLPHLATH
jgi:hypothetical protein